MTVQELIDELMKVEDKNIPIYHVHPAELENFYYYDRFNRVTVMTDNKDGSKSVWLEEDPVLEEKRWQEEMEKRWQENLKLL